MILSTQQILYYFIFILCISVITIYCIKCSSSNNEYFDSKIYEKFEDMNNENYFNDFTDSEINNKTIKNALNKELSSLKKIIYKYSIIDPSININNNNFLCDNSKSNNCMIKNTSTDNEATCLFNHVPVSCSNYFDDYIKEQVKIDLTALGTRDNIIIKISQLFSKLEAKNIEIDYILDTYLANLKIEDQQNIFIKYNISNLDDKTKLLDKTTEEYEKNENDINVNQVNFTNFLSKNNNNINKINFYYKIIIGVVITIIVVGIFNIFITKYD